jgi:hypothetical protein
MSRCMCCPSSRRSRPRRGFLVGFHLRIPSESSGDRGALSLLPPHDANSQPWFLSHRPTRIEMWTSDTLTSGVFTSNLTC